jgi:hypothetical protein
MSIPAQAQATKGGRVVHRLAPCSKADDPVTFRAGSEATCPAKVTFLRTTWL